ncbi:MAG TPA: branched-chain amino acid ABC transporter permease [Rhodopila sp.]|uniref:branched-chain amino acid ABC transporter permease n=1 Tax=Rhodopila sp. TaxID=2480087 RepID=UPI002B716EE9|nr:branched-chain amino acid ABC transporter permease [Rhodopila sp.]HVY16370.1 branched-chain amino acid ABC transporter permease [Rhodopila sp.]
MIRLLPFVVAALLPLVANDYLLEIGSFVAIQSISVIGLGYLTGFAGRISLAQGGLYGIGAYTAALLVTGAHCPPLLALPAAILAAVLVGTLLGSPAIRLSGLYFVMSTIGLQQIIWIVLMHWSSLTNGPMGVREIPPLSVAGFALASPERFYWACVVFAAGSFFLARRVVASRFGLFLRAVSDDELSAATSGVRVVRTKVLALALSSAWAGAAGFLHAFFLRFVHPDMFTLDLSVVQLTMAMFGGYRSLDGMMIATLILGSASEYLRPFGQFRLVVYGGILLLTMMLAPRGILPALAGLRRRR